MSCNYHRKKRERNRAGRKCSVCDTDISDLHALRLRCDDCQNELRRQRGRDWRNKNLEKAREQERSRKDQRSEHARKRYRTDLEYRKKKIEKARARSKVRRDVKRDEINALARQRGMHEREALRLTIASRDGFICSWCGNIMPDWSDGMAVHIDHIIPRSKGGPDSLDNLQLLHVKCNLEKGNRIEKEVRE